MSSSRSPKSTPVGGHSISNWSAAGRANMVARHMSRPRDLTPGMRAKQVKRGQQKNRVKVVDRMGSLLRSVEQKNEDARSKAVYDCDDALDFDSRRVPAPSHPAADHKVEDLSQRAAPSRRGLIGRFLHFPLRSSAALCGERLPCSSRRELRPV